LIRKDLNGRDIRNMLNIMLSMLKETDDEEKSLDERVLDIFNDCWELTDEFDEKLKTSHLYT